MREDYPKKRFLEAESLAKRESFDSTRLINWCELGDLKARHIGKQWFVDLDDWGKKHASLITDFQTETSLIKPSLFSSALIALLLIAIISWVPFATRFQTGSQVLTSAVGTTVRTAFTPQAQMHLASVYDGLWIRLERLWFNLDQFIQTLGDNLSYFWNQATDAWAGFVGGKSAPPETTTPVVTATTTSLTNLTLDATSLESLKAQIKSELLRELERQGQSGQTIPNSANAAGLVVLPSSGNPAQDAAVKQELKNSFSDQVEVKFDQSGQAGVITPIFPSGRGDNYLFILTQLKQTP